MKNRLFILAVILCLVTALALPICAAPDYLVDEAHLLDQSEATEVETQLAEISARQGVDVVVVTVDSLGGRLPMAYADDYYDYNGYGPDGILLLVSIEDNDWWVSTKGYGITVVTDAGLAYMADRFVPYLSDGEFSQAFLKFAQLCDQFITQAKTGDPYDGHNLPKDPFSVGTNVVIALVIGLIAAWIATAVMKGKLKSVRQQVQADAYITADSLQLTHSRDIFLYSHISRRERPKQSSGSSTHTSSSGSTHGGGGGKF